MSNLSRYLAFGIELMRHFNGIFPAALNKLIGFQIACFFRSDMIAFGRPKNKFSYFAVGLHTEVSCRRNVNKVHHH
jgi:hypothetical protein